jgi:hypothetical protein
LDKENSALTGVINRLTTLSERLEEALKPTPVATTPRQEVEEKEKPTQQPEPVQSPEPLTPPPPKEPEEPKAEKKGKLLRNRWI